MLGGLFSGEFVVVNKHLLHDLTEMGLWSPNVKNRIIYEDGSVQKIPEVPEDLKVIFKYAFHGNQSSKLPLLFNLSHANSFRLFSELFGRSNNEYWLIWLSTVDAS